MMQNKRTIESILDLKTGREVFASDFLEKPIEEIFQLRYEIETGIREKSPRYVCYYCKQAIKLRGQTDSKKVFHFAHLKDSDECPVKTNNLFTKEEILRIKYNGAKESELHQELKTFIAISLKENQQQSKGIEFVEIEIVYRHLAIPRIWKKPDVTSIYNGKNVVVELQLSTTFLSVINSRQEFYKENKAYILWVFNNFETDEERRKFTQSDVFFNNNRNGFELNEESKRLSIHRKDLILKCNYLKPIIVNENIDYEWNYEFVSLSDLTFDSNNFKVYYYDVDSNFEKLQNELQIRNDSKLLKLLERGEDSDIYQIFENGYKCSESEKKYLNELYKQHVEQIEIVPYASIGYRLIIAIVCMKLGNPDLVKTFNKNYSHKRAVFDILCLKLDKIIGYNIKSKMQVSHFFLGHCAEHTNLYLKAISAYQPDYIKKYDTTGKFQRKISEILQSNKIKPYDQRIIFRIFPELN